MPGCSPACEAPVALLSPPLPIWVIPHVPKRETREMRADPNRCLLLIDDEPAQRRLVTAIGARAGWWVRGASDFDAAKKMFEDPQEPKFDAILLDHWLPGEAGTELIREIRTTRPDLPLLVLTAQNDVAVAVDAMRA